MQRREQSGGLVGDGLATACRLPAPAVLRSHLDLLAENAGLVPWCGPSALALATGLPLAAATELLRGTAPAWYPESGPIVTTYWRDLLAALRAASVPFEPLVLPERRPSLLGLAREGLSPGWYLVRVTDHFLLLRSHGFGLVTLHDNRHSGVVVNGRSHGRRKVTHIVRLLGGPLGRA
jgi:hypothetical protein